jgi:hypothetical protein
MMDEVQKNDLTQCVPPFVLGEVQSYSSPSIVRIAESKRFRRVGLAVSMGGQGIHVEFLWRNSFENVRFQVIKAASMKFRVFWEVAPCSHVEVDRRFRSPL